MQLSILVTGASGGIGRALVRLAKSRGDYVVGISRRTSDADVHYSCDV
jgi:NAD(P)-dependent dehydrogenase (short-subunit alcohol dehydrogenase family)